MLGAPAMVGRLALVVALLAPFVGGCGSEGSASGAQDETEIHAWNPAAPRNGNLRIATFNIRNFPAVVAEPGAPPEPAPTSYLAATDAEALLSVLDKLQFDLMAVQEIRDPDALSDLLETLSSRMGRKYSATFSENVGGNDQHVGLVFDAAKVRLAWTREHEEIDVSGTLRPGLSARVESLTDGGVDFEVMVLHLASGDSVKRAALRAQQAGVAAKVVAAETVETKDPDYLVLGDLNTAREESEFGGLDTAFATGTELERQDNSAGCTAYWIKKTGNPLVRPSWLDQVYRSSLEELDPEVPIASGAHCAEHACQQFESRDASTGTSFYAVSDHCPVYFELRDTDAD